MWATWWYRRGGREACRTAAWQAVLTTATLGVLLGTAGWLIGH